TGGCCASVVEGFYGRGDGTPEMEHDPAGLRSAEQAAAGGVNGDGELSGDGERNGDGGPDPAAMEPGTPVTFDPSPPGGKSVDVAEATPVSTIYADLGLDGDLDRISYFSMGLGFGLWVNRGDGAGNFGPNETFLITKNLYSLRAVDADGDGDLDLE